LVNQSRTATGMFLQLAAWEISCNSSTGWDNMHLTSLNVSVSASAHDS